MNTELKELPLEKRIKLVEDSWDSIAADQQALPSPLNRRQSWIAVSTPMQSIGTSGGGG